LLYPQLNLIPPFTDSGWFSDGTPTWALRNDNPHSMNLTLNISANGRLIWIPVEMGKTYTFSFGKCTGLYRLYKRKVGTHDTNMVLANHSEAGKPDTYTFTVDSSYQGFITIRLTYGMAGTFTFENLQLEEGTTASAFKPYVLGNKRASLPKEVINTDISGASSHIYPYGNVISVKEDVRLWGYKIQVGTPLGTFDSVIYEWNNGSFGEPLFREVITATASGVMDLSYKGTLLKAGKKYYIGRNDPNRNNDSVGNAGVYRKTGMPPANFKFISTLGGTQFYSPAIDFPSTWYYIFSLEIEATRQIPAIGIAKKNLLDYSTISLRSGTTSFKVTGSRIDFDAKTIDYAGLNILVSDDMLRGKTVTWSVKDRSSGCTPMLAYLPNGSQTSTYIGFSSTENKKTVTIPANCSNIRFYVQNDAGKRGDFFIDGWQAEYGTEATAFELYTPINPPATLSPVKNYVEPFTDWFPDNDITVTYIERTDRKVVFDITTATQYKGIRMPIYWDKLKNLLGKKVTLSAKVFSKNNANNSQIQLRFTGGGANTDLVLNMNTSHTKDVATYHTGGFLVVQMNVAGTARITVEELQLEISDKVTEYRPLMLGNPVADLVPQKNLFDGVVEAGSFDGVGAVGDSSINVRGLQYMSVDGGKQYTFSVVGKAVVSPRIYWYTTDKKFISSGLGGTQTAPINARYARWHSGSVSLTDKFQFEEGAVATEYKPYTLGNPKL
jgi:hypothetical protein